MSADEKQLTGEIGRLEGLLGETNKKLEKRLKELEDLEEAGKLLGSSFDLERILFHLMYFLLKITEADVGSIMLAQNDTLITRISWGLDEKNIRSIKLKSSGLSVCEEALRSQKLLFYKNIAGHQELVCEDHGAAVDSLIVIPLLSRDRVVGVLNIMNGKRLDDVDEFTQRMMLAIAGFAAVAIDNAILYQEALTKQKYEQGLKLGKNIQLRLLPQIPPQIPGYQIAMKYVPTQDVGGDYFDLIAREGKLHVIIADVASKGVPAALIMTATRAILRGAIQSQASPRAIIEEANRLIYSDINRETDMFVTLFYGCLDLESRLFSYTNAGHCYPLVFRHGLVEPIALKDGGVFLGILENAAYEQGQIVLNRDDFVLFYTDGAVETYSDHQEHYGDRRIWDFVRKHKTETPDVIIEGLYNDILRFSGDRSPFDDIAMVGIKIG